MKEPVEGTLQVTVCAQPWTTPESLSYSAIVMGAVSGPGIPSQAVEHHCQVPAKRCPTDGQRVPVTVDRADPTRLVIEWDRVPLRDPLAEARAMTEDIARLESDDRPGV